MEMITLSINGQTVQTFKGATVWEAARDAGISIPTLCHLADLTPEGSCRVCVVEVEGARGLVTACTYPTAEGMVVRTNSPVIREARKTVVELILANHPQECLTCQRNLDCELQSLANQLGITEVRFKGEKRQFPIDDSNPFIIRDNTKCVLCGRCVRVCQQVQGCNTLDWTERGFNTKVAPAFDDAMADSSSCVFCGNCVAACPVGALTEKPMHNIGLPDKKVKTTCPYCGTGCTFDINVKDGKVIGVTSTDGEVNGRSLCVKGRFGYGFIHHPDRLTTPLVKKDGKFVEASWSEAISLVAEKLGAIKKAHGADAIALLSSARCTNEDNYMLGKFSRAVIGTNNVDHCARNCHAPTVAGMATAYGSGAMTNTIKGIAKSDFIFAIGTNTTETHPIIGQKVKQAVRNGATMVVVDPRKTELAKMAHYHLQIKSGSDIALLNSMANVIIAEDLWDKKFVEERTEDFEALKATVAKYTPESVEKITGVPAEIIKKVARGYSKANNASILFTMGITQHICGTHNVFACANLAMLCGQIGKEFSGVNPLRGQNNVQGSCDMGALPNVYPGYQSISTEENRAKFATAWGISDLPDKPGLTVGEMMEAAGHGQLKGMYIMGENPVLSDPDANHVEKALGELDFLVVQDIFLTETAQLADIVLPGASFAEKEGTFTNTERRVQRVREAIEPVGSSKPDWEIICMVAEAMGYSMKYESAAQIFAEIAKVTPSYGGMSHERLDKSGLQWPCPTAEHPGTPYLHKDKFSRGLGKFHAVEHVPPAEQPDAEYPLILSTGRRLYHYHTGTMTARTGTLEVAYGKEHLEMNHVDAEKYSICDGDMVQLSSRRGSVKVAVKVTEKVIPGLVFTSFHYPSVPINQLTNPVSDPIAKIPELKVCAVKVEKMGNKICAFS